MPWVGRNLWELKLSPGWDAQDDDECLTLTKSDDGAFQLSGAVKQSGLVSQADLRSYEDTVPLGGSFEAYSAGLFQGFTSSFTEEQTLWRKYWVAHRSLLIFATYNGTADAWRSEEKEVNRMLCSLRIVRSRTNVAS